MTAFNDLISGLQSSLRKLSAISGDLEKLVSLDQLSDVQYKFSALDLTTSSGSNPLQIEDGDHIQVHTTLEIDPFLLPPSPFGVCKMCASAFIETPKHTLTHRY